MDAEPSQMPVIGYATAGAIERRRRPVVGALAIAVAALSLAVSGLFAGVYGQESLTDLDRWRAARRASAARRSLTPSEINRVLGRVTSGGCNASQDASLRKLLAAPGQELVSPASVSGVGIRGMSWSVTTQGGLTLVMFYHDATNRTVVLDAAGRAQWMDTVSWATGERSRTTFGPGAPTVAMGQCFHASVPVIIAASATAAVAEAVNFALAGMLGVVGVRMIAGSHRGTMGLRRYAALKLPAGGAAIIAVAWLFYASSVGGSFVDEKLSFLLAPGMLGLAWAAACLFWISAGPGGGRSR